MALWLTRAGSAGEYEEKFLEDKRIYLTWVYLYSDLRKIETKDELKAKLEEMDPRGKLGRYQNWASQIWPFVWRMKKDDWVILPSKKCGTAWSIERHIIEISSWADEKWGKLSSDDFNEWQRNPNWWECLRGCN